MATKKKQMHIYVEGELFELLREKAHEHRTTASRITESCIEAVLASMRPGESFDDFCSRVEKKGARK